jgi:hypothetical protein
VIFKRSYTEEAWSRKQFRKFRKGWKFEMHSNRISHSLTWTQGHSESDARQFTHSVLIGWANYIDTALSIETQWKKWVVHCKRKDVIMINRAMNRSKQRLSDLVLMYSDEVIYIGMTWHTASTQFNTRWHCYHGGQVQDQTHGHHVQ